MSVTGHIQCLQPLPPFQLGLSKCQRKHIASSEHLDVDHRTVMDIKNNTSFTSVQSTTSTTTSRGVFSSHYSEFGNRRRIKRIYSIYHSLFLADVKHETNSLLSQCKKS
jgi:hypothetical protein